MRSQNLCKHAMAIASHSTFGNPRIIWVQDDTFIAPLQIREVYECMMTVISNTTTDIRIIWMHVDIFIASL